MNYRIILYPSCFHKPCLMQITVPQDRDPEEYIDEYIDSILADNMRYNADWEFYPAEPVAETKEG